MTAVVPTTDVMSLTGGSAGGVKGGWLQCPNQVTPVRHNEGKHENDEFLHARSESPTVRPVQTGLFDFSNVEAIKERVKMAKARPSSTRMLHDLYWNEGIFQVIAKHQYFENFTLGVIVCNAFWIWIDTDYQKEELWANAHAIFIIADCLFFGYFVVELFIRFMAFRVKTSCFTDAWFVFDSLLVALYAFDPFVIAILTAIRGSDGMDLPTSILRLFRLARLSRLVRMLRSLPELMIMIKGMMSAAASVGYTLGLLLIITYVFAIALTQLSDGYNFKEDYFASVPLSMYSLIIYGTFLDALADFADAIREESTVCLVLSTVFVALASMTVMNMLIGVLCEVISAVALEEKESMMIDKIHEKFGKIVEDLDANKSGTISWTEFQKIVEMPDALQALESVNVDAVGMIDMAEDMFFDDEGEPVQINFEQFMELVLDLRGGQDATLKDIMTLGKRFNRKFMEVKENLNTMDSKLDVVIHRFTRYIREAEGTEVEPFPSPRRIPSKRFASKKGNQLHIAGKPVKQ